MRTVELYQNITNANSISKLNQRLYNFNKLRKIKEEIFEDAKAYFETLLCEGKYNLTTVNIMIQIATKSYKYEYAKDCYELAKRKKADAFTFCNYSHALAMQGKVQEILELYQEAFKRNQISPHLFSNIIVAIHKSTVIEKSKKLELAIKYYEIARTTDCCYSNEDRLFNEVITKNLHRLLFDCGFSSLEKYLDASILQEKKCNIPDQGKANSCFFKPEWNPLESEQLSKFSRSLVALQSISLDLDLGSLRPRSR